MNKLKIRFGLGLAALAFCILWLPCVGNAYVTPATADFGEVAVGSDNVIPLIITNTTGNSYILYFHFDNYECGFFVNRQEVYLAPNGSLDIEVRWAPGEETACSARLLVTSGGNTLEEVPITGTAVSPDQVKGPDRDAELPSTLHIGECDTEVLDRMNGEVSISELFGACHDEPSNHGQFVRCVVSLANDLRKQGLISQKEHAAIKSCAARSGIPSPQLGEANQASSK